MARNNFYGCLYEKKISIKLSQPCVTHTISSNNEEVKRKMEVYMYFLLNYIVSPKVGRHKTSLDKGWSWLIGWQITKIPLVKVCIGDGVSIYQPSTKFEYSSLGNFLSSKQFTLHRLLSSTILVG